MSDPRGRQTAGTLDRALRLFGDVRPGEGATVVLMSLDVARLLVASNEIYTRPEGDSRPEGDRLFPPIAVGSTAGAPLGAALGSRLFAHWRGAAGSRGLGLLAAAFIVVASPAAARAEDPSGQRLELAAAASSTPAERKEPSSDGRRTLRRLPANLGWGVVGVFHAQSLGPLVVGGGAAGISSIWDQDLHESVGNPDSGFGKALETAGGWPTSVLVAGLFTAGRVSHAPRLRAMSYDLVDAAIVNLGYVQLLKVAVGRPRPDGSNDASFPSGHSSNAFALATVGELHYGWRVGVPAYAVAGVIGYSRIVRDKHYLSDVVAGATLGIIVGRAVVRVNGRPLEGGTRHAVLAVSPAIGRADRGARIALSF